MRIPEVSWDRFAKSLKRPLMRLGTLVLENVAGSIAVALLVGLGILAYGTIQTVQDIVLSFLRWIFKPVMIPQIWIAPWALLLILLLPYPIYLLHRRFRRKGGEYFDFEYMGLEWRTYVQSGFTEDLPFCPDHPGVQYAESPGNIYTTPKYYAYKCPMSDKHSDEVDYELMQDRYCRAVKVARSILQNELPSPPIVRRGTLRHGISMGR